MKLYFENIRIINPEQHIDGIYNLLINDGIIMYFGIEDPTLESDVRIIDGTNLVGAPGFFDMHVHFRQPGFEQKENIHTGAAAASNGGFTGVLQMPNTNPCIDDVSVVNYLKDEARGNAVDVHISGAITQKRQGQILSPMKEMASAGVLLFTDDGGCITSAEMMKKVFEYASENDLIISQHCEEMSLTKGASINESDLSHKLDLIGMPTVAEDIIVARDILMAEYYGNCRYHVQHLSTKGAVDLVRNAKSKGLRVTAEVTPHHFSLTDELLASYNTNYKMNPPLRKQEDIDAIKFGLKDGTIDSIATDHAPHTFIEKNVSIKDAPFGIIGLETSLGVTLTNLYQKKVLTLNDIVMKMSINPRRILGLKPIKISEGLAANLTFFEPNRKWNYLQSNSKSKSQNTPFENTEFVGKPYGIINNGIFIETEL
ncbi:MAG: dihydroorotase [bacterium]